MGRDSFDARLIAIIRRNHPDQAARMDFPTLVGAFRRQAAKASHYGLTDEHSAATYVYTAWLMGEEFDTRIPAVAQILADRRMKAAEKAQALGNFARLVFRTLSGGANDASRSAA
jgi:predicted MarR family transcription regulator